MLTTLQHIDKLKAEYDALLPMKPKDEQRLWEKLRLEWNYNSNHIEGNTMTYGETQLLFRLGDEFRAGNNSMKDVNEMRAHDVAVEMVKNWSQEGRPLLEADIRSLNKTLLVKEYWSEAVTQDGNPTRRLIKPGEYKEQPNHVVLAGGRVFRYAEPVEVPAKMQELLEWYNTESVDLHPVIKAAYIHYKFVTIHPFDDGNGRVSRLLMNYELLKAGYPPIVIKSIDKKNYFYALQQADAGELETFVEYISKEVIWSLELAISAIRGDKIEEDEDFEKETQILAKKLESKLKLQAIQKEELLISKSNSIIIISKKIIPLVNNYFKPLSKFYNFSIVNIDIGQYNPLGKFSAYRSFNDYTSINKVERFIEENQRSLSNLDILRIVMRQNEFKFKKLTNNTFDFDMQVKFKFYEEEIEYQLLDFSNSPHLVARGVSSYDNVFPSTFQEEVKNQLVDIADRLKKLINE